MTHRQTQSTAGPPGYGFPPLHVSVQCKTASTLVISVGGELDLATGPVLHQHLEPYNGLPESDGHPQRIVYHLADLEFMDASGLAALLTAIDGHGPHTITVRKPSPLVRRVLELVDMGSMIEDTDHGATR